VEEAAVDSVETGKPGKSKNPKKKKNEVGERQVLEHGTRWKVTLWLLNPVMVVVVGNTKRRYSLFRAWS
jgi:hypothetical protein